MTVGEAGRGARRHAGADAVREVGGGATCTETWAYAIEEVKTGAASRGLTGVAASGKEAA